MQTARPAAQYFNIHSDIATFTMLHYIKPKDMNLLLRKTGKSRAVYFCFGNASLLSPCFIA